MILYHGIHTEKLECIIETGIEYNILVKDL